jgi:SAM-dependent methyltransferase
VGDPTRVTAADGRLRTRQGACALVDGVPCPDPATTASLLPGVVVGDYLDRHADRIGGRLLDVGAGERPYEPWYGPRCSHAVSTDVAPHDGLSTRSMAEALPFADDSFDVVLLTEVLEHVDDHARTLDEVVRVLAPGGTVVVTVPFMYPVHEAPHDHRRFTHHGLEHLLVERGLIVEDLGAKGGAAALAVHLALTPAVQVLRLVARRLGTAPAATLRRGLLALERGLLELRRRAAPFSRSARRVSLGYLAVARKPDASGT